MKTPNRLDAPFLFQAAWSRDFFNLGCLRAVQLAAMEPNYPGGWRPAAISVQVRRICGPELVGGTPPLRRHFKPTLLALAGV